MSDIPNPVVTYESYLHVDALLSLQQPRSDGPEHDEMLFRLVGDSRAAVRMSA